MGIYRAEMVAVASAAWPAVWWSLVERSEGKK